MAKLVKNADGSVAFVYDIKVPEEQAKAQRINKHKALAKLKGKDFKTLTPADKDALLELLLEMHNLI